MSYNVIRLIQGQARVVYASYSEHNQELAEKACANLNRLAGDTLTTYIVEADGPAASDDADFFAPPPIQPTLYQENVCRPGWIQPMPEEPMAPLYTPGEQS